MTESEGVTRYQLDYRPGELPSDADVSGIFRGFDRCRGSGLIGQDPGRYDGYAYGNISVRANRGFVISGTQTGGKPHLAHEDLAWVEDFDLTRNWLRATGPARPSSEAMTHGQIYRALPAVRAVIHVHSVPIWQQAGSLGLPLTAPGAAYGTPAMANEVRRLLASSSGDAGVFVMGGHEDGVVAYASDMDSAGGLVLELLERANTLAAGQAG